MRRRRAEVHRLLAAISVLAVIVVALPGSALAKIPEATVETSPAAPSAGEPIRIVVRLWAQTDHTTAAPVDEVEGLDGFLIARMTGSNDLIRVPLPQSGPGRFEGTITLPAGDWTLTAFLGWSDWNAYAVPPIALSVKEPGPNVPALLIAVTVVGAVLLVVALRLGLLARLTKWQRILRPAS